MNPIVEPPKQSISRTPILIGLLGLGTVSFAVLFLIYFVQAQTAAKNLNLAKIAARADGAAAQKKIDAATDAEAAKIPFRSYEAPSQFGSFVIKFPKSWSSRVNESESSQTQVNLSINPDFIRYKDDQAQAVAIRVRLIQATNNSFLDNYADAIKSGDLKKTAITVSGQNAVLLQGHYQDDSGTAGIVRLVAVPVRDKTLVFTCENSLYLTDFDASVAQSKIVP